MEEIAQSSHINKNMSNDMQILITQKELLLKLQILCPSGDDRMTLEISPVKRFELVTYFN